MIGRTGYCADFGLGQSALRPVQQTSLRFSARHPPWCRTIRNIAAKSVVPTADGATLIRPIVLQPPLSHHCC
jgi:hypothetical protein